jgi:hypothetical protein
MVHFYTTLHTLLMGQNTRFACPLSCYCTLPAHMDVSWHGLSYKTVRMSESVGSAKLWNWNNWTRATTRTCAVACSQISGDPQGLLPPLHYHPQKCRTHVPACAARQEQIPVPPAASTALIWNLGSRPVWMRGSGLTQTRVPGLAPSFWSQAILRVLTWGPSGTAARLQGSQDSIWGTKGLFYLRRRCIGAERPQTHMQTIYLSIYLSIYCTDIHSLHAWTRSPNCEAKSMHVPECALTFATITNLALP